MKNKGKLVFIFILIYLLTGTVGFAAENLDVDKNVYMILLNRYTLSDLKYMPNLQKIIDNGSIGLMNTRGLSRYNGAESYLTINASNKAMTDFNGTEIYNLNEKYKDIYERRLGCIKTDSSLANVSLNRIIERNKKNNYTPTIGILGDSLHKKGFATASFGNSDIIDYVRRPGSLIPMDSKGLIDYGNVDNILVNDRDMPYGFRTDYEKLLEEVFKVKDKASLIVIDTGDLDRLYSYSIKMNDDMFFEKRKSILKYIDNFLGKLVKNIEKEQSLLMVLSPNCGDERVEENKLSPLILWGCEIDKGLLSSSTTKRDGIVANLDIGPTVAEFLDTSKEDMIGNVICNEKEEHNLNYIQNLNDRLNVVFNSRSKALLTFSIFSMIVMILCAIILSFNMKLKGNLYKVIDFLLILVAIVPFTLISISLFNINSYSKFIIINSIFLLVASILIYNLRDVNKLLLISGVTYAILVIDLVTNGYFTRYSILAPDPIIGARYFGIGNELVGVFLSSMVIFLGYLLNKTGNKLLTIVMLIFSVVLIGHPRLGANVGGSISVLFSNLFFILVLMNKKISFRKIIGISLVVVVFILCMSYIDIKFNPTPTHLGKAMMSLNTKDDIANNIIVRKLLMNIKLVGSSIWAKALLTSIFTNIAVLMLLREKIKSIFNKEKGICIGLICGVVGSIVGFLFNDSGVLLSSIAMIFITITLLYTIINYEVQGLKE